MEKYHPDAIHLDQNHNAINNGIGTIDGMNGISGNLAFHDALAAAMPQIVLSGECVNEITLKHNSFAQLAGLSGRKIDEAREGYIHPISAFLFSPYTTFYGHLGVASPHLPADSWYAWKDCYERTGVIPTLKGITEDDLESPEKPLTDLLAEAKIYCQYQLTPSFETEAPPNALLALHGEGESVARFEDEGGIRRSVLQRHFKEPETISCRVSNVTSTSLGSIPGWMAYNHRGAIGLAQEKTYPYSDEKFRLSDFHLSRLPETAVITSQRRMPNFFVFRIENRDAACADLVKLLGRGNTGYQYFGGKRHRFAGPIDYTASGTVCRQEHADKIWMHPPWRMAACDAEDKGIVGYGTGITFVEYFLRLPPAKRLALLGSIAMNPQREGQSDGSTFIIRVTNNGVPNTLMAQHYSENAPREFSIDISNYASKEILLELQIAPGPNYKPDWDWAFFIKPRIVVEKTEAEAFELDSPVPVVALLDANGETTLRAPAEIEAGFRYAVTSTLPNTFVFVVKVPDRAITVPYNLMSPERHHSFVGWDGIQRDIKEKGTLTIEEKNVSLKGIEKSAIVFQTKQGGIIYFDYLITLPDEPPVRLEVDTGLLRGALLMVPEGLGNFYTVEVNGLRMITDWTQSAGWNHHSVDLSEYAGKTILLTLARYQKHHMIEDDWGGLSAHILYP